MLVLVQMVLLLKKYVDFCTSTDDLIAKNMLVLVLVQMMYVLMKMNHVLMKMNRVLMKVNRVLMNHVLMKMKRVLMNHVLTKMNRVLAMMMRMMAIVVILILKNFIT